MLQTSCSRKLFFIYQTHKQTNYHQSTPMIKKKLSPCITMTYKFIHACVKKYMTTMTIEQNLNHLFVGGRQKMSLSSRKLFFIASWSYLSIIIILSLYIYSCPSILILILLSFFDIPLSLRSYLTPMHLSSLGAI